MAMKRQRFRTCVGALAASVLALPLVAAEPARGTAAKEFAVKSFGAVGDGKTLGGPAIQKAIDAAAKAGGGTVVVPAGTYVSGALRLASGVTLRLDKDAVIQASPDSSLFPPVKSRWEGTESEYPSPLIVAVDANDVTIAGAGTLAGNVRTVLLKGCRNARVEGVKLTCRLRWTLHLLYCDGVTVDNCRFETRGGNTDGIDPDSSRNVVIRRCRFATGDDCIAIKSGKNAEGVKIGRPSENITIEDCVMERGHGGVSIGSEMSGGVRNVTIRRCGISGCGSGIRIKTRKGRGGVIEGITVTDCRISKTGAALLVDMLYRYNAGTGLIAGAEGIPAVRRLSCVDITGAGNRKALSLVGMPDGIIDGIVLKNVKLTGGAPGRIANAKGVVAEGLSLDGAPEFVNVKGTGLPAAEARPAEGRGGARRVQ